MIKEPESKPHLRIADLNEAAGAADAARGLSQKG